MNARQKKFAEYYAQCGNTVQSAIKAGYSVNYANKLAHKLLVNIGVAEYLKSLIRKKQAKSVFLTAIERQAMLSDIRKKEYENQSDRIIDTLNKMTGEYIDRVELSGDAGVVILNDIPKGRVNLTDVIAPAFYSCTGISLTGRTLTTSLLEGEAQQNHLSLALRLFLA